MDFRSDREPVYERFAKVGRSPKKFFGILNWFFQGENFLLVGPDVGDFNSWIFRTP